MAGKRIYLVRPRQTPALSPSPQAGSRTMSVPWLKGPQKRAAPGRVITTPSTQAFLGGVKDTTGKTAEYSSQEDECPVCKSDRYLNPKLRLLVSSCYHKMCESCIDRLFTLGPQGCPICGKILRKMAFTPQTFEDLVVEKEVAVRRRIAKEFSKRREDFSDLRSYNDYLEEVEDITFNLINDRNKEETEARIAKLRVENAALTELNIQREERDAAIVRAEEERVQREQLERAEEARHLEEDERMEREREKQGIIDILQSSDKPATKVIAKSRAAAQKRALRKAPTAAAQASTSAAANTAARMRSTVKDEPHVPFTDDWYAHQDKFVLRTQYGDPGTDALLRDLVGRDVLRAGGYDIREAWERAIRTSVVGLAVQPIANTSPETAMLSAV